MNTRVWQQFSNKICYFFHSAVLHRHRNKYIQSREYWLSNTSLQIEKECWIPSGVEGEIDTLPMGQTLLYNCNLWMSKGKGYLPHNML
jgi:hypothetical protein